MGKISGSSLMFDEEDVKTATEPLPRLIRIIFYALGITNEGYLERYRYYYRKLFPNKTPKEFSQKSTADRKFLMVGHKLTFNMSQNVLMAMGYDITEVSFTLKDRLTGEIRSFSTTDTVEKLKSISEKENEIGLKSL